MSRVIDDFALYSQLYQHLIASCSSSESPKLSCSFRELLQHPKCIPWAATLALEEVYSKRIDGLMAAYHIACEVENIGSRQLTERCAKMISDFAVHDYSYDERISKDDKEKLAKISDAMKSGVLMEDLSAELFPSPKPKPKPKLAGVSVMKSDDVEMSK